jgi:hypothetical protein
MDDGKMGDSRKSNKIFGDIVLRSSRKSYIYYYFMLVVILLVIVFIYFNDDLTLNKYASLMAIVFIVGIIKFTELHRFYRLYTITDLELIVVEGIILKKTQRFKLKSFSDASLTQKISQRILGIGNIQLLQFDLGVEIKNINKPAELLKKITERI